MQLLRTRNAIAEHERSRAAAPARIAPNLEHTFGILGENQDCVDFPQLPGKEDGDPEQSEHEPKSMDFEQQFPCCIARKVGRKEISLEPNAIEAMDKEWKQLETTKRPDPEIKELVAGISPKSEKRLVCATKHAGPAPKYNFVRTAELCMEKEVSCQKGMHSANTKGEPSSWGITFEMNTSIGRSSPNSVPTHPSMEASRAVDAVGSLDGSILKYGDAKGAYTQSYPRRRHVGGTAREPMAKSIGVVSTRTHWRYSYWHCMATLTPEGAGRLNARATPSQWGLPKSGHVSIGILRKEPCSKSTWTT